MKWVARISMIALGTVLVCGITLFTTGFVVNAYVQSLLTNLNIKWEGQPASFGGLLQSSLGWGDHSSKSANSDKKSANVNESKEGGDNKGASASANPGGAGSSALGTDGTGEGSKKESSPGDNGSTKDTGQEVPENAVPVMGAESAEASSTSTGGDIVVTPDDLAAKKKDLPDKDKEEIFQILMTKLPQKEMQAITASLEGGLTESEMIEIQQMMSKYLDKTEYAKVMKILGE